MNAAVQAVLDSFDALSDEEQHEVTVAVLRRTLRSAPDGVSNDALRATADALFRELDGREEAEARPAPR